MIKHKLLGLAEDYEKLHRENVELKEALTRANYTIASLRSALDSVESFFENAQNCTGYDLRQQAEVLLAGLKNDLYGQL